MPMARTQAGFALIEVAVVIVILGLLMGWVMKGQELIANARVRNLITQQDGIRAAYIGFYDRYRFLPGDYNQAATNIAGVTGCGVNGDGNGRIEDITATPPSTEYILAWEHLSKSGFINGSYTCNATESASTSPVNPFGVFLELAWDAKYAPLASPAPSRRHNLKTGSQIPSDILAEIDRKIDDGNAAGGSFRFSDHDGGTGAPDPAKCMLPTGQWSSQPTEANCGATTLL
jgi:prepilin-type N-terminal cleavage/methylation domain-containing protein